MGSLRDIRQKIKGVSSTKQITNAMKMMSTARLFKASETLKQNLVYNQSISALLSDIKCNLQDEEHPCFKKGESGTTCFIVIGGERGLCGGFNQDLHNYALDFIKGHKAKKKIITMGNKVTSFFEKEGFELYSSFLDLNLNQINRDILPLSDDIFKQFLNNEIDEIIMIYTSFVSISKKEITNKIILPIQSSELEKSSTAATIGYEYTPTPEIIFDNLLPRYLQSSLFIAVLESQASEHSARMTAMTSATDRAGEIVDELNIQLHRSRQAQITQEISEVISGAQV